MNIPQHLRTIPTPKLSTLTVAQLKRELAWWHYMASKQLSRVTTIAHRYTALVEAELKRAATPPKAQPKPTPQLRPSSLPLSEQSMDELKFGELYWHTAVQRAPSFTQATIAGQWRWRFRREIYTRQQRSRGAARTTTPRGAS